MISEAELVDRILLLSRNPSTRTTVGWPDSPLDLPVTPEDVDRAEAALGFKLPPLLRSLYIQVGNGGFGPGYGIIGLEDGYQDDASDLCLPDLYQLYIEPSSDDLAPWPEKMLPLIVMGCANMDCVDCSPPDHLVVRRADDGRLIPTGIGFTHWMEQWAETMEKRARNELTMNRALNPLPFAARDCNLATCRCASSSNRRLVGGNVSRF